MKIILLNFFVILGLGFNVFAQQPNIPQGSEVRLQWIAPPDTDVVKYIAYFSSDSCHTNFMAMYINEWTEQDTCEYRYNLHLDLGEWCIAMTAVDRAGNESKPSEPFFFNVMDAPPGRPSCVIIKLIK